MYETYEEAKEKRIELNADGIQSILTTKYYLKPLSGLLQDDQL